MNETRICANCGIEHPLDTMYQVEGDWLCESCADRLTVVCDYCNERIYEENAVMEGMTTFSSFEHCAKPPPIVSIPFSMVTFFSVVTSSL